MDFSSNLILWYSKNKRDLPWRNTSDAYKIWLSEIILQQTRVNQGLPYYESFISHFPTVFELAQAEEQVVLKLWQGLGYYSRARNLHQTAKIVVENYNGKFPTSYQELLKLKGVGSYTAAAIASFSSNEPVSVVDGNVFRVLARIFNIDLDISKNTTKTYFQELAGELMSQASPSLFNQAIMEFGALQCVPKSPVCNSCVFQHSCVAFKENLIHQLPVKVKSIKTKIRFLNYVLIEDASGKLLFVQRKEKDIWQFLYELELVETSTAVTDQYVFDQVEVKYGENTVTEFFQYDHLKVQHKLSHQNLSIQFFYARLNVVLAETQPKDEFKNLPFPIVLYNFLEKVVL